MDGVSYQVSRLRRQQSAARRHDPCIARAL